MPLLAKIAENRSNVVMPVIDEISDQNFYYHAVPEPFHRGVFRWRLEFGWKPVPQYEMERRKDDTDGIRWICYPVFFFGGGGGQEAEAGLGVDPYGWTGPVHNEKEHSDWFLE